MGFYLFQSRNIKNFSFYEKLAIKIIEEVALGRTESVFSAKENKMSIDEFKKFFNPDPVVDSKVLTFFGKYRILYEHK